MTECSSEPRKNVPSMTADYEQRVLHDFVVWYRKENPALSAAASEAHWFARNIIRGLTATQVVTLLQEHPEWTHQKLVERLDNDATDLTIGEIARRHFVKHLELVIQRKGLQAVFLSMREMPQ